MSLEIVLYWIIVLVILLYLSVLAYAKATCGVCRSRRDLTGKTVIVTGANTGIGLETARDLASRNAKVILACRSLAKGQEAARDIVTTSWNTKVSVKKLDLSSLQSVRAFAKDVLENEERLDILVNNAGVSLPHREESVDGLEMVMASNHFGHFLLTNLLLPLLKKSAPSRIVVVSSMVYKYATLSFQNLNGEKEFNGFQVYAVSKLANILFVRELSSLLYGSGVTVNALHPGVVKTELIRNTKKIFRIILYAVIGVFFKSAKQGAQTSIYAAVSEELEGVTGKYLSDCQEKKLKRNALDKRSAELLWEVSERVTGLNN